MLAGAEAAFNTENDPTDVPVCRYLNVLKLKTKPNRNNQSITFFIWNLIVAFRSLALAVRSSLWVTRAGNLPA